MKEHLVALVYILVLSGMSFVLMAKPLTARVMASEDFVRRRNLWIAVTVITFLAHDVWLAMLASALVIAIVARREANPVALYCVLLFAVPQFGMPVSGLGLVNYLFEIDHPRMLALVLLLPAAVGLISGERRRPNPHLLVPDLLFCTYFVYVFIVNATADSITGLMRFALDTTLDHGLLYFVVTRSITSRRQLIDVLASFVMGVAALSAVAVFENLRSWLVYESLRTPLGVPAPALTAYLLRQIDDGGYLRSYATLGHAIALGFTAMIAITFQLALARSYKPKALGIALVLLPVAALLAAVSRGPWLGCTIAVVVGLSFGPGAKRRLLWMAALAPLAIAALFIIPQGQKFLDLLPFVGSVEPGSVTYRTQLIDRAMVVFWQNPIFGSLQYIYNPVLEEMRQGQGIIDIVNSYIGVALPYGAVGLLLFVAPSVYALLMSAATSRRMAKFDADAEAVGRALAVTMLGVMLVITAVSHYFHIPIVHWLMVSLCMAYVASARTWPLPTAARPPQTAGTAPLRPRASHRPVVQTPRRG